jgi:hypothetical protein
MLMLGGRSYLSSGAVMLQVLEGERQRTRNAIARLEANVHGHMAQTRRRASRARAGPRVMQVVRRGVNGREEGSCRMTIG